MIGTLVNDRKVNSYYTDLDISSYGKGLYIIQIINNKTGVSSNDKLIVQ